MISNGKIILKKSKPTIRFSWTPLSHITGYSPQYAEQRNKHVSVQRITNESYASVSKSFKKSDRIKGGKITIMGFPFPLGNLESITLVIENAIPTLENFLTGLIVSFGSGLRIVNPLAMGEIAGLP